MQLKRMKVKFYQVLLIVLAVLLSYTCSKNSVRSVIICEVSSDSWWSPPISHAFCTIIMTIAVRLEHSFVTSSILNSCNYLFLKMLWKESKNFWRYTEYCEQTALWTTSSAYWIPGTVQEAIMDLKNCIIRTLVLRRYH